MIYLLKYMRKYKKESILGPTFKMLEALFELIVPIIMIYIIDIGIGKKDLSYILKMGGILLVIGIVGLISSVTAQYFAAKASVGFSTDVRFEIYKKINVLSYKELDSLGSATLITRITSDINQIQSGINIVLRIFLRSPFIVFGAMIMASTISLKVGFLFLITILILSVVVFGIMLLGLPLYKKNQEILDAILDRVRNNLSGMRTIRGFNQENKETANFFEKTKILKKSQIFSGNLSAFMNPVTYVIVNFGIVLILWKGAREVNIGSLTQGQLIALVNYMSQILVELIKFAFLIITITRSLACAKRVETVLKAPEETDYTDISLISTKTPTIDIKEILRLEEVSFHFPNSEKKAVENVSFQLNSGEVLGIIGGTGSGKTTLINLIPRLYEATSGKIYLEGREIGKYSNQNLRKRIGMVPQKVSLFKGTIKENIILGNQYNQKHLETILEISQMKEIISRLKYGLDSKVEEGGKNLSGGQKQRIAIARGLIRESTLYILDDSTSALDYGTDARLRKALRSHLEEKAKKSLCGVIIVSQRAASIAHANKILILEEGKVAGLGTHEELYLTNSLYKEICKSQNFSGGMINETQYDK